MLREEMNSKYEMTIGIECHVQLNTKTKMFSGADNDDADKKPNSVISPIDYALPGMLPVLNGKAVGYAIRAGLALNSVINKHSQFDRKHYFYPDLPSARQLSQMYHPIIGEGKVYVIDPESGEEKIVRIEHAHLEEDAGKLVHHGDYSLVDLNRAGKPLIEIVSMPDIHSAGVAKAYVMELQRLMIYAGVTNGNLYHGNMRFDVNISVAEKGAKKLGTRVEIKNLNSFRSVERAADYEFERQVELVERGEKFIQETRGWDDAKGKTLSQRSKENAHDYRYMPDPDVPPIVLTDEQIEEVRTSMPMMPRDFRLRWEKLGLDNSVVESILNNRDLAVKLTEALDEAGEKVAVKIAHWFTGILLGEEGAGLDRELISVEKLIELAEMVENNELSSTAGKEVFVELLKKENTNKTAQAIAEEMNLVQVNDESMIEKVVDEVLVLPEAKQAVDDVRNGEAKAIGFLVGQVMRRSGGKANPTAVNTMIRKKLS